eukprot:TRINITY_DN12668_c0_g1_i2.p1 TRINITY_DN12668_c0_g1~~TRINITY_DN12668_c0_g1_i2.p1  ORF type:complete len:153 (+),score=7.77 TRINITY_DN12668_c0_g1_i2:518-976(+)
MNSRFLPSIDFSLDQQVQNEEDKYWLCGKDVNSTNLSDIQEHEIEFNKCNSKVTANNENTSNNETNTSLIQHGSVQKNVVQIPLKIPCSSGQKRQSFSSSVDQDTDSSFQTSKFQEQLFLLLTLLLYFVGMCQGQLVRQQFQNCTSYCRIFL